MRCFAAVSGVASSDALSAVPLEDDVEIEQLQPLLVVNFALVRLVQLENAYAPISLTLDGMVTDERLLQEEKALPPMLVIPS